MKNKKQKASPVNVNVSDFIGLSKDEVVLKTFKELELRGLQGKCYFVVTNYRLIYFVDAKEKLYNFISLSEYDINTISSIKSIYGKIANKVARIFAYIFLIIGLVTSFLGLGSVINPSFLAKLKEILLISGGSLVFLSILLFIFGKNKAFFIEIKTSSNLSSEIKLTSTLFQSPFPRHIATKPSKSSFDLIHNLGRCIIDAKNFKNVGIMPDEALDSVETFDFKDISQKKKIKAKVEKKANKATKKEKKESKIDNNTEPTESIEEEHIIEIEEIL